MLHQNSPGGRRSPGTISILCLGDTTLTSRKRGTSLVVRHDRYEWKVPADIRDTVPHNKIVFNVYDDGNGRQFLPEDERDLFIAKVFHIGQSLLTRDRGLNHDQWIEYCIAKLAFDRLQRFQERLQRRLISSADLTIRRAGRLFEDRRDILPANLGSKQAGAGRRLSVDRLIEMGRRAAIEDGIRVPTEADAITYGLFEAARLNPLRLPDGDTNSLVRMALFDFSRLGERVTEDVIGEVSLRLKDAVRDHDQDGQDKFNQWFRGGKSNLVKSLANRTGYPLGKLDHAQTRRALVELGWRGFRVVGDCLGAFALAFARSLHKPLTEVERQRFQAMYLPQAYLGGLPLHLLHDRIQLLKPVLAGMLDDPANDQLIGTLHRMLLYWAEMMPVRREADRLSKRPSSGGPSQRTQLDFDKQQVQRTRRWSDPDLQELFQIILELRKVQCPSCKAKVRAESDIEDLAEGESLNLQVWCEEHGSIANITISWDELMTARRKFDEDDDD